MKPSWVIDLHNGGCAAFVLALNVARKLLAAGEGRTALIAVAQNAAGQFFDQPTIRRKAQAAVPGDGAAVGLVAVSDRVADSRCRVPHLRRIRRRDDARPRPAPQVVAARAR